VLNLPGGGGHGHPSGKKEGRPRWKERRDYRQQVGSGRVWKGDIAWDLNLNQPGICQVEETYSVENNREEGKGRCVEGGRKCQ